MFMYFFHFWVLYTQNHNHNFDEKWQNSSVTINEISFAGGFPFARDGNIQNDTVASDAAKEKRRVSRNSIWALGQDCWHPDPVG